LSLRKLRVEITLPRFYKNGKKIEDEKFLETDTELRKSFGGCERMPNFEGTWISSSGKVYADRNQGFKVDVPNKNESLSFIKQYKGKLERRFDQDEIYIIAYEIYKI